MMKADAAVVGYDEDRWKVSLQDNPNCPNPSYPFIEIP
jgi:hypothetical protein